LAKKKRLKKQKQKQAESVYANEDRRSVAITVVWMMAFLTAIVALPLMMIATFLFTSTPEMKVTAATRFLPELMFILALVSGTFAVCITPLVYKFREIPPPIGVTVMVLFVGLVPWVIAGVGAILAVPS
jgi:ABC-type polysaccharide/polyol phosphate export permease